MNPEGVWHSICFSGLGWCFAHEPNDHRAEFAWKQNWWWWPQGLVVMEHRDVRSIDGIEPEEFLFWINVKAVCWQKILIQVTCEISKHHKLLQVWNSNLFFNVCGVNAFWKNCGFCFATSHPPVICLTLCLHLFHLCRIRLLDSFLQNYDIVLENGRGDSFRKINLSEKVLQAGENCSFWLLWESKNPLSSVWREIW